MKIKTVLLILIACALWSCKLDKRTTEMEGDKEGTVGIVKPPGQHHYHTHLRRIQATIY